MRIAFFASWSDLQRSQKNRLSPPSFPSSFRSSSFVKASRHAWTEVPSFDWESCSISIERSRKASSRDVTVSQLQQRVSVVVTPSKIECTHVFLSLIHI